MQIEKDGKRAEVTGDVCYMLQDWARANGYGEWDNGGELVSFDIEDLVYTLYDDECGELLLRIKGEMKGDLFTVDSVEVVV